MLKRVLWIALALAILSVFPAAAQQAESVDAASFVPADFAGFIRLHMTGTADRTLRDLFITAFAAERLEPQRSSLGNDLPAYEAYIPFDKIFDVEKLTFTDTILPWLKGDMVLAYRTFDGAFQTDSQNTLMILPTDDIIGATSLLSAVVKAQDKPSQETYRDINIYIGDTSSFAVTSQAVFVGSTDMVKSALDIQAGAADSLIDSPVYVAVHDKMPEAPLLSGYVTGEYLLPALNGLLNGQAASQPLLAAFGEALAQIRSDDSFEKRLLNGGFDGVGVSVELQNNRSSLLASAVLHSPDLGAVVTSGAFDESLLNLIPRGAFMVHSGTNISGLLHDALTALPVSTFIRQLVAGWPVRILGTDNPLTPPPSALEIQSAVSSYLTALSQFNKFDLQKDLLDHLSGNYVVALFPRPNDPVPVLDVPFDTMILAQAGDAAAAQASVSTLLQFLFGLKAQTVDPIEGWDVVGVGDGKNLIFRIAIQDNLLLITTGQIEQDVIRAQSGDNRLVSQPTWTDLVQAGRPDVYADWTAFANTFFPVAGGASPSAGQRTFVTLRLSDQGAGLVQLDLRVVLPVG